MQKTTFLDILVLTYLYLTALENLPNTPENRDLIDNVRATYKDYCNQIPNAKHLKQPKDYYNFVISAGIGKKTAAWFLNKTNQKQLIIAFKNTKIKVEGKQFSNWRKTFYKPFREKYIKIYKNSTLSEKFCCQHNIY